MYRIWHDMIDSKERVSCFSDGETVSNFELTNLIKKLSENATAIVGSGSYLTYKMEVGSLEGKIEEITGHVYWIEAK